MALAAASALAAAPPAEEATKITVSADGFRPSVVTLRKGETARLQITATDREHCFAVEAFRVEKRVVTGRTTTVDLIPDRLGTFPFYCCLEPDDSKQRGRIVVSE